MFERISTGCTARLRGRGAGSESEGRFGRRGGRRRRFRGVGLRDGRRDGDGDVLETFRKERETRMTRGSGLNGGSMNRVAPPPRDLAGEDAQCAVHDLYTSAVELAVSALGAVATATAEPFLGELPQSVLEDALQRVIERGEGSNADLPDVAHPAGRPVLGDVQLHILADEGSRPGLARVPPGAVGGRDDAMPWMERLGRASAQLAAQPAATTGRASAGRCPTPRRVWGTTTPRITARRLRPLTTGRRASRKPGASGR